MPFGTPRYGATILGYTNSSPCDVSIDVISPLLAIGDEVIVAACVGDNAGPQLNGKYIITNITGTLVTLNVDTTSYAAYVSGGYLTILQTVNPQASLQANEFVPFLAYTVTNFAR